MKTNLCLEEINPHSINYYQAVGYKLNPTLCESFQNYMLDSILFNLNDLMNKNLITKEEYNLSKKSSLDNYRKNVSLIYKINSLEFSEIGRLFKSA